MTQSGTLHKLQSQCNEGIRVVQYIFSNLYFMPKVQLVTGNISLKLIFRWGFLPNVCEFCMQSY